MSRLRRDARLLIAGSIADKQQYWRLRLVSVVCLQMDRHTCTFNMEVI